MESREYRKAETESTGESNIYREAITDGLPTEERYAEALRELVDVARKGRDAIAKLEDVTTDAAPALKPPEGFEILSSEQSATCATCRDFHGGDAPEGWCSVYGANVSRRSTCSLRIEDPDIKAGEMDGERVATPEDVTRGVAPVVRLHGRFGENDPPEDEVYVLAQRKVGDMWRRAIRGPRGGWFWATPPDPCASDEFGADFWLVVNLEKVATPEAKPAHGATFDDFEAVLSMAGEGESSQESGQAPDAFHSVDCGTAYRGCAPRCRYQEYHSARVTIGEGAD